MHPAVEFVIGAIVFLAACYGLYRYRQYQKAKRSGSLPRPTDHRKPN